MIAKWIDALSGRTFYNLGKLVAKWPAPFILLPLIASGLLGYFGLSRMVIDDAYIFHPDNGQTVPARTALSDAGFFSSGDAFTEVIVTAADGGDVLFRDDVVAEVLRFHHVLTTSDTSTGQTFGALCFRDVFRSDCVLSGVLELMISAGSGTALQNRTNLTYPYYKPSGMTFSLGTYLGSDLGGVTVAGDDNTIISSKALHLAYNVRSYAYVSEWIDMFRRVCSGFVSDKIIVNYVTSTSVDDEVATLPARVAIYIGVAVGLLILFSVVSCMMLDWVMTKPWLAVIGVLSAVLASVSSIGLLLLAGIHFSSLNVAVPFLLLGIGVDDMFVMIAAWRKCDMRLPVPERTGRALADAGVSITITSITDCLAFAAGIMNVFPSVRRFCIYAAVGVAFDYLYQITFFTAFMSLTGRRERANRHCLTCWPVLPKSEANNKSAAYRLCCAGGVSRQEDIHSNPSSEKFSKDPFLNKILYNHLVPIILKQSSKAIIFILYAAYLGVAIWGCLQVRVGLRYQNTVAADSHVGGYFDAEERYFREYGRPVDIFTTEPLEYWTVDVQQALLDKLKAFDQSQYFYDTEASDIWLRDYLRFLYGTGNPSAATNKTAFLQILTSQFLPTFGRRYYGSIKFAENNTGIAASRFTVIPQNVTTAERGKLMMLEARSIAEREPIEMTAYSYDFFLSEQLVATLPSTLQTVGVAVAIMFVVCFLLIPHGVATFFVTFAMVSINVGLVGYMALWGVYLDIVSVISIIMSIGFSVDFFAHVTYSYVTAKAARPEEKLADAFRAVGMPILQSSISTILSLAVLGFFPAYIFQAFFKTIFLVMVFGAGHGLFILPLLLTTLRPSAANKTVETKRLNSTASLQDPHPIDAHENQSFTPQMHEWVNLEAQQGIDNPTMSLDDESVA